MGKRKARHRRARRSHLNNGSVTRVFGYNCVFVIGVGLDEFIRIVVHCVVG